MNRREFMGRGTSAAQVRRLQEAVPMRPAKKPMKAPFVVTISAVAAAASLVAGCGGKVPGGISDQDILVANPPIPPRPGNGTTCTDATRVGDPCGPNESKCAPPYATSLECSNGYWISDPQLIGNPPPPEEPCPSSEPPDGTSCWGGSSGNTYVCSYKDRCSSRPASASPTRHYECSGNTWKRTSPSEYVAECPAKRPISGESCADCARDLPVQCTYGQDVIGCPPEIATCDLKTLTWNVSISSCNPPPPPQDAGAPDP